MPRIGVQYKTIKSQEDCQMAADALTIGSTWCAVEMKVMKEYFFPKLLYRRHFCRYRSCYREGLYIRRSKQLHGVMEIAGLKNVYL